MAISPLEFNGAITRTQDYTSVKHNQDNKALVDQSNFQTRMEKEVTQRLNNVHDADDTEKKQDNSDAKEKGNGTYAGDGGRNRKKQPEAEKDGKVIVKRPNHFDITV